MKTISSILCALICVVAIPISISRIIENDRPVLFIILCICMLPGFVNSINYLWKKYNW